MLKAPEKFSPRWYWITGLLFAGLFLALTASRSILKFPIDAANVTGFAIIAAIAAAAAGVGGFLGGKIFFSTAVISYLIGLLYLLFIVLTRAADGWSDLTGIIAFMFISGMGMILGLTLQIAKKIRAKLHK